MTDFYTEMAATAAELLAEFGAPVTLIRDSGGTFDPVTGTETGATSKELTPKPNGVLANYKTSLVDGTRIKTGDRLLILDTSQAPETSDRVKIGTAEWSIVNMKAVKPADTPLVHFVQVRQ